MFPVLPPRVSLPITNLIHKSVSLPDQDILSTVVDGFDVSSIE